MADEIVITRKHLDILSACFCEDGDMWIEPDRAKYVNGVGVRYERYETIPEGECLLHDAAFQDLVTWGYLRKFSPDNPNYEVITP